MTLSLLSAAGVRNLANFDIELNPGVNVFYGENGAGKSSILECIYLLALGRSFRNAKTRTVLSFDHDSMAVRGELTHESKACRIEYQRMATGHYAINVNEQKVRSIASLAHLLPIQIIHSSTFELLTGTPGDRRRFLDWGVFHHSKNFFDTWKGLQTSLKNRNSLLRSGNIDRSQIAVWNQAIAKASELIDAYRVQYLEGFVPRFESFLSELTRIQELRVHYFRGWDKTRPILELLDENLEKDRKVGFTQLGPQRADLRFKIGKEAAVDVVSRGQQKLIISALKLAQAEFLQDQVKQPVVFLIDDLPSELDQRHIQHLGELFERLGNQVLLTSVAYQPIKNFWKNRDSMTMFHVEQGVIKPSSLYGEVE